MTTRKHRSAMVGVALVALAAGGMAGAAQAGGSDGDIIVEGDCTGSTEWKLKLSPEDTHLEASFDLDNAAAGSVWHVTLSQGLVPLFDGDVVADEFGNVDVDVVAPARAGLSATAVSADESCVAELVA